MPPLRKHLLRREVPLQPRFITFSRFQRLNFLSHATIADHFAACLERARRRHRFLLVARVAMPNHVHPLLVPRPRLLEGRVEVSALGLLSGIKRPLANAVIERWRAVAWPGPHCVSERKEYRFWQRGGGFDRNIRDGGEFAETIDYIHQNPVKRGLVDEAAAYRWSSARVRGR